MGGTADFGGRRIGKRKEKKLTVEAGQPGVQTRAGGWGRKMMGEKEKRRKVDVTAYIRATLHLSQNHVVTK